jgi:uncharacterized iron-regulated membrane protein
MSVRKIFFWMHLAAGCVAGAIVLLMSVTGVLLTYERQMIAHSERSAFQVTPGPHRKDVEGLLASVSRTRKLPPNAVLTIRSEQAEPVEIAMGRDGSLYLNPYTGAELGVSKGGIRPLFQKIRAWHRWIGVEGDGRATTKAITGASNLAFLFIRLSGAYLWIPARWTRQHLRPVTWFRGGLSGKARDFNWHNVIGFWSLIPLFLVVLCAVPISYTWGGNLIYRLTGSEPPRPPAPSKAKPAEVPNLNALWERAARQWPGWRSISAPLRAPEGEPLTFNIDHGDGGQPQLRATLALDSRTGEVKRWQTFGDNNSGQRLRLWSRFTHTGEAFGLVGQTIAGIVSAGAVVLVWTGIALALRRFNAWRRRAA